MKFIIGSTSKRKIDIVNRIIKTFFNNEAILESFNAISKMPDTPWNQQTFEGAKNRALDCLANFSNVDFYIGLESGLVERYGHIYEEAWAVVIDKNRQEFNGYSSGLKVPDFILKIMNESKMEHCNVMTIIEKKFGNLPNDTWGTYSGGIILRETSLEEALRNAFIQIICPENGFYKK